MVSTTLLGSFNLGQNTLLGDVDGDGDQETLADIFSEDSENGIELSEAERAIFATYVAAELYGIVNDPNVVGLADDVMTIISAIEQLGSAGIEKIGELKVEIYEIKGTAQEIEDETDKLNQEAQALIDDALNDTTQETPTQPTEEPPVKPLEDALQNSTIPTEAFVVVLPLEETPPLVPPEESLPV